MKALAAFSLAAALAVPAAFAQNNDRPATAGSPEGPARLAVQRCPGRRSTTAPSPSPATSMWSPSKFSADQKTHHVKGVTGVNNQIQVNAGEISDQQLQAKVNKAITYNLWGNVPVAFQTVSAQVQNGVVTLSGHTAGPVAAADAVAVVANTKGVRDVVDEIQVDPISDFDNDIRLREFRAIYGYPLLSQYAMDPEKPIRIQVVQRPRHPLRPGRQSVGEERCRHPGQHRLRRLQRHQRSAGSQRSSERSSK